MLEIDGHLLMHSCKKTENLKVELMKIGPDDSQFDIVFLIVARKKLREKIYLATDSNNELLMLEELRIFCIDRIAEIIKEEKQ